MPLQKLPKLSQGVPAESKTMFGIDRVEVVAGQGFQHQAFVHPVKIGAGLVEGFVGDQSDAGGILSEGRKRVVHVIFSAEVGNVGRPEVFGFRAFFLDPIGDAGEHCAAAFPVFQIV